MPRTKAETRVENQKQFHAYTVYRDLGYGRSKRRVAELVGSSPPTVCRWAEWFEWDKRVEEYTALMMDKQAKGAVVKTDDPVLEKMRIMMEQMESAIDSAFAKDALGRYSVRVKIRSMDELVKLVSEYRKLLETYRQFVTEHITSGKSPEPAKIGRFSIHFGDVSQEERIKMMETLIHGNDSRGNGRPAGGVQDADYTEVPGRGDED